MKITELHNERWENGSPQNEHEPRKIDYLHLFYSSIWSASAGAVVGEAVNLRLFWPIHLTPLLLPINWCIFPFKPLEGVSEVEQAKQEKAYRISSYALSSILGFSAVFLTNQFIPPLSDYTYSFSQEITLCSLQGAFLSVNLLASYSLQQRAPISRRMGGISGWVKKAINYLPTSQDHNPGGNEELQLKVREQITETREKNRETSAQLKAFKELITGDCELLGSLHGHLRDSEDILLPPPIIDDSGPVPNPLAEEWRQVMQEANYYESCKTRIFDFLQKNPEFNELLKQKLKRGDQETVPVNRQSLETIEWLNKGKRR